MILARTFAALSVKRRAAALLAALCVVIAQVESMVPDEHDGDARASQLVVTATTDQDALPGSTQTPPASGHSVHIDHCAHAHVFATGTFAEPCNALPARSGRPDLPSPLLASVTTQPHSRPPIA